MPKGVKRTHCRICGEPFTEDALSTRTGAHLSCATKRMVEHNRALSDGEGPDFDLWKRRSEQGLANAAK